MSNSNTAQESLEIMKESEKKVVEESVNKTKYVSRSPSKEEVEKDGGEEVSVRQESQRRTSSHGHARKRAKSNSKLKLVRSLAVCEESSSPFVDGLLESQDIIQLHVSCPSDKEEEKSTKDGAEKEEKDKNKEKAPRKMLSRDSSQEYTDSTGIDLHEFLVNTLKKNPRDRMMLLKLEQEILEFISDNNNQFKKFPQMTSYHRMLLHRVAAYFGMDHNVDQTGKAVIINKTSNTRIPEQRFSEHIKDEKNAEFPQRFILKRDDTSMDRDDNQIRLPLQDGRRSKSIEEREEEYQRVRERIFARESGQNGYLTDSRGNRDSLNRASGSRQSSTESEIKSLEPRPWSSTDSDGSIRNLRPPVTKASSFSGISILTRGDSIGSSKGSTASRTSRAGSNPAMPFSVQGLVLGTPEACSQSPSSQPSRGLLPCTTQQPQPQPPQQPPPQPQGLPPAAQQQPAMISQADELSNPFGQISLSRQGSTEATDPSSAMFQSSLISQHPQQTGFIMATPGQPIPTSNYSASGHTAPTQQVLQPQGYIQPPQQIQVSYYPPGQYPNSSQQYRSLSHPVAYSSQRTQQLPQQSQQPGLQPMMSNQQQTYQGVMGVQQAQPPGLLNSQRNSMGGQMQSMMGVQQAQPPGLLSSQRSSMGSQMQGLMVQYTPLPSYQVPVANESQSVVQQPFQQPVLVPASQSVQGGLQTGGVPIYYSVIPTAQQNGTSPSVGFLQPPGSEQYQMPQSPSPCSPPQMQQQYSGVSPSGPGVVVMQLNVPNGPQAPQNPPVVQWSHCKYYSLDQRGQKPGDLYNPDTSAQASTQLNSPITSPTQSPTPSPVTNLNSVCTGLSPLPVLTQFPRPMGPAQGDGRYSLLGQPLQYNLSICPPPLLHSQPNYNAHQGQTGMKHGNRSKRQALKSASTDLGTSDVVLGRVLEVTDLPEGITRTEADKLFTQLAMAGAKIQWLKETQGRRGDGGGGDNNGTPENGRHSDLAALYTIVAVFPSPLAAQNASLRLNNSLSRFKLRVAKKNYDLRVLERASSQ
ncbi:PREDICTED: R3H domain-containing protein 2 isoform X6 [Haliaeetus leucocephalus]|nr:PREDICTED: R3H domain-containing protein 2 isoform X6 [Haliaeetus leucocephalus]XP_010563442.1 PREDICTED: R3H domain-containing protein 2 isoform X6 [Haliaeetus leucocephalus]XP_010563443.1 PREDICTED: R3H domain-containing protein 2 isoform X6 [Haliaeetus leucocephalus]